MSKKKARAPKRIKTTSTDRKREAKKVKIAKLRAKKDLKEKRKVVVDGVASPEENEEC